MADLSHRISAIMYSLDECKSPIETAPRDEIILVWAPGRDGLPPIFSMCKWHDDAGFCIDELREPKYWWPWPADHIRTPEATHYVNCNSGRALFVKEAEFFQSQGGLREDWGKTWRPVVAKSIGDARRQAAKMFGVRLSHIHAGEE